jgi:GNAT superfamily N-acetyltransferase
MGIGFFRSPFMETYVQDPILTLTEDADPALREQIAAVLVRYNEAQVGVHERRPLLIVVRDPKTNAVIGGLAGRTALGLLFIDLLALPMDLRGQGLGTRLLHMAEEEARKRGCRAVALNSASFQAPDFYERRGYRVLGEVEGDPGIKRIFMAKELNQASRTEAAPAAVE